MKHDRVNELLTRLLSLLRNTLTIIIIIPSRILLLLYSLFDTAVLLCLFLIYIYIFTGMLVILQSIAYVSCHIYSRLSVTFFLTYQIRWAVWYQLHIRYIVTFNTYTLILYYRYYGLWIMNVVSVQLPTSEKLIRGVVT